MPLVKEDLILNDGSNLDPANNRPYVRIAKVVEVRLFSQVIIVQYIDGDVDDDTGDFLEGPEEAIAVIGSPVPETTYNPSCTVYGKGDIINVMVMANGSLYAVSLCDLYNDINRENFALCEGWALYDVLNGLLIDGLDDTDTPENSYLTFRARDVNEFLEYEVTKITGDPTKRNVFRRMLDYFLYDMSMVFTVTTDTDPQWGYDKEKSGPDNNPMRHMYGRLHKGKYVCGFPYVEDIDFTSSVTTLANDLTLYHPTLDIKDADCHPLLNGDTLKRYFENPTVVWWDDEEPTHVLVIGAHPSWDGTQLIVFAEVPVYSMCGRKFLERPVVDEGLETEYRDPPDKTWQLYSDQVRIIHTIDRSQYIDFTVHDNSLEYSERLVKAVAPYMATQTGEIRDFCILDGSGWESGAYLADVNRLKRIQGTIERIPKDLDLVEPHINGSTYDYEVLHNDPLTTGTQNNWYENHFEYEYNNGDHWERQRAVTPTREYQNYNNGVDTMERTLDFDFNCDGYYSKALDYGRIYWSDVPDGSGVSSGNDQIIDNTFSHKLYRNGGLVIEETWDFRKGFNGQGNYFELDSTYYICMYADVEYDLFVFIKIVSHIDPHQGTSIGWTFLEPLGTHYQYQYGIVLFEGVEYIIWRYEQELTVFPAWYNFFPWLADSNIPIWPGDPTPVGPYSIDTNYNGAFFYTPTVDPWMATLKPGVSSIGVQSPAPLYGPEAMSNWSICKPGAAADRTDLLWVSIDYEKDSWAVWFECPFQNDTNKTLIYPNGPVEEPPVFAIYSFEGAAVTATAPEPTMFVDLNL